jgi:hypothetical protein
MKRPTKSITRREAPRLRLKPTLPGRSKAGSFQDAKGSWRAYLVREATNDT